MCPLSKQKAPLLCRRREGLLSLSFATSATHHVHLSFLKRTGCVDSSTLVL
jgi:hypothetical protein